MFSVRNLILLPFTALATSLVLFACDLEIDPEASPTPTPDTTPATTPSSDGPVSVPRPTDLPGEPERERLRALKSRAIAGAVHSVYQYARPYSVLNLAATHRISSMTLGNRQARALSALVQEIDLVAEATCTDDGQELDEKRVADDVANGTIETFFTCKAAASPAPRPAEPTPTPTPTPAPATPAPEPVKKNLDPTNLPGEPGKLAISNVSSTVVRGTRHTLFKYDSPYAILGISATHRLSSQTGENISALRLNRLQSEAVTLMTDFCQSQGKLLGSYKSANDEGRERRENFFNCADPEPGPAPAPVEPEIIEEEDVEIPGVILIEEP